VSAALHGVDGVGVGHQVLVDAVAVLESNLHVDVVPLLPEVNGWVDGFLAVVEILDVGLEPALVVEGLLALMDGARIHQDDLDAAVEEGQLPQTLRHQVPLELDGLEDLGVR